MINIFDYVKSFVDGLDQTQQQDDADVSPEDSEKRLSGITFHYLNKWLLSLDRSCNYNLQEELRSGELVTHLIDVTHGEMCQYARAVYIPSHPPKFVVTKTC